MVCQKPLGAQGTLDISGCPQSKAPSGTSPRHQPAAYEPSWRWRQLGQGSLRLPSPSTASTSQLVCTAAVLPGACSDPSPTSGLKSCKGPFPDPS